MNKPSLKSPILLAIILSFVVTASGCEAGLATYFCLPSNTSGSSKCNFLGQRSPTDQRAAAQ